jgi:hypothetical protein
MNSTNNGDTWNNIITDPNYQGVQISFTNDYVYMAADSYTSQANVNILKKSNNSIFIGSLNRIRNIAVPGGVPFGQGTLTSGASPATSLPSYWYKLNISLDGLPYQIVNLDYTQCTTG